MTPSEYLNTFAKKNTKITIKDRMPVNEKLARSIRGFLDAKEGRRLYEIALEAGPMGPCLEIGGYCGKSTVYLGTACKEKQQILFSVDHHQGSEEHQPGQSYFDPEIYDSRLGRIDSFKEFRRVLHLTRLEETVVPIVSRSDIAARYWNTPLSLVFIDGGHTHETVLTDYRVWSPHIIPDGYLLIHDVFENPEQGGQAPHEIYESAIDSGLFHSLPMTETLGVLRRNL